MLSVLMLLTMFEPAAPVQARDPVLYIATYIDVDSSSTEQGVALIKQYRDATRTESGNSRVDVVREIGRTNRFVIIEVWKDPSSFDAHEQAVHTTQFRTRLRAIHNSPYDQREHQGFAIDPRAQAAGRDTVSVVTHVDVPPQRTNETELVLKKLAEDSRNDDGYVRYEVFQQTAPRTNHFTVYAVWRNRKAFDSHETKAHTRQFREAVAPMLSAAYDERLYIPLS